MDVDGICGFSKIPIHMLANCTMTGGTELEAESAAVGPLGRRGVKCGANRRDELRVESNGGIRAFIKRNLSTSSMNPLPGQPDSDSVSIGRRECTDSLQRRAAKTTSRTAQMSARRVRRKGVLSCSAQKPDNFENLWRARSLPTAIALNFHMCPGSKPLIKSSAVPTCAPLLSKTLNVICV